MSKQILLLVCITAAVFSGCQKSSVWDRVPLSGTAQLDGTPFTGAICFRPARGNSGPSTTAPVTDGRFEFDRRTGPVRGDHTVILIPKDDPDRRASYRVDTKTTVPSEEPFTLALEFTSPVLEPEPPGRGNEFEEDGTPK